MLVKVLESVVAVAVVLVALPMVVGQRLAGDRAAHSRPSDGSAEGPETQQSLADVAARDRSLLRVQFGVSLLLSLLVWFDWTVPAQVCAFVLVVIAAHRLQLVNAIMRGR